MTAIQGSSKTEFSSPIKQVLSPISNEDRPDFTQLNQISSMVSREESIPERDADKTDNTGLLRAMDQNHASSTLSKKQRKRLRKQQEAQARQLAPISGSQHVNTNEMLNGHRMRINSDIYSKNPVQIAKKPSIGDRASKSPPKTCAGSRNHGKKAAHKRKDRVNSSSTNSLRKNSKTIEKSEAHKASEASYDRRGNEQKQSDEPSDILIGSSALSISQAPSVAILPDVVISKGNKKKGKKKKKNPTSESENISLEVSETSPANTYVKSKSPKFVKPEEPLDHDPEPLNEENQTESLIHNREAQETSTPRYTPEASQQQNADAVGSVSPALTDKTATFNAPKEKEPSKKRMTISELTEFNKSSQKFKSAKIKHDQELNDNSARSSSNVTDQPPANPENTENTNVRGVSSPTVEDDSDSDNESGSHLLQELKTESSATRHSSPKIHDESTQPKTPDSTDDIKKSHERHVGTEPIPVEDDSMNGGDDPMDKVADEESESVSSASSRKRGAEDDLNNRQSTKRLRVDSYALSASQDLETGARPLSALSAESSRSRSPQRAIEKSPDTLTTKSKQKVTSTTKRQPKATKLTSSSSRVKSTEYVFDSESEEADTTKRYPQAHDDNDGENISSSNLRHSSKESMDLDTETRSPRSMHNSVTKNTSFEGKDHSATQRKPRRLQVQQAKLDSDRRHSRVSSTDHEVKKIVHNYTLGSRKMGPFDEGEQEIIKTFEVKYRAEHGLSEHQFNERIHLNAHNDKGKQAIWSELMLELPGRDRKSIQRYCRRKRPATGTITSPFTEEDDQQLMNLIARYGTSWVKIGQEMDRAADALRDRYRNVLKDNSTRTMQRWSHLQVQDLKRAVGVTAARALESAPDVKDLASLIVWGSVSQEMEGARGRAQCANKWNDLETKGKVSLATEIKMAAERLNLRVDLPLLDRLDTGRHGDTSTSIEDAVEDQEGEAVQTPMSNDESKDRLQSTTKKQKASIESQEN